MDQFQPDLTEKEKPQRQDAPAISVLNKQLGRGESIRESTQERASLNTLTAGKVQITVNALLDIKIHQSLKLSFLDEEHILCVVKGNSD